MADRIQKTGTVALVGSESLIGREIRDVFETSHFPARLSLIASGADETGVLTEQEGEPTVVVGMPDRVAPLKVRPGTGVLPPGRLNAYPAPDPPVPAKATE